LSSVRSEIVLPDNISLLTELIAKAPRRCIYKLFTPDGAKQCSTAGYPMVSSQKEQTASRWSILLPCVVAMLAIANLQYAWTFFTTDITKALHVRLDAVQWTLTFFIIAQTALFPINAYLVDRFGPRLIVTIASLLVAIGWVGAGRVDS